MNRRNAIALIAGGAMAPSFVIARRSGTARIGFLYFASRQSAIDTRRYPALLRGLSDLGYVNGKTLQVIERYADGDAGRLPAFADELVNAGVDVIVPGGNPAIHAAFQATKTIPIVIAQSPDPVGQGWAKSLARPGGNLTGLITVAADLELKLTELSFGLVPGLVRLGVLVNPSNRAHAGRLAAIRDAAKQRRAAVISASAQSPEAIAAAFVQFTRERAQALIVLGDTYFLQHAETIASHALAARLPSSHPASDYAEAGGMMSYGTDIADNFRRAATYIDKILNGARPGELPIERPSRFELLVNRRTARTLGMEIPHPLLLRADRVID